MTDQPQLATRLARAGQSHLLAVAQRLDPRARETLLRQVAELDLAALGPLIERHVRTKAAANLPASIDPPVYYPARPDSPVRRWDRGAARRAGERLLREGKIACFTVAGGQGTRLGFDGPKGCYPAGAVTGKPLFQVFAEGILRARRVFGVAPPWYIMTSPQNHDATLAFFDEHEYFGLDRRAVTLFPQGTVPTFELATGRVLLEAPDRIATNPDGHGGSFAALDRSGALDDMARRGVEHISYFQVDNPIVRPVDPVFLGLHAGAPDSSAEMSSKMIPKAYAEEKLGMFARVGGRTCVIEYSDLPMERQRERLEDGSLRFLAGSIAVHVIGREFAERVSRDASFDLPWHRAEKKAACVDPETLEPVNPASPNAVKLERFVFDALPMCRSSIVLETDRIEEFAPIKNAQGVDSPESCARIQSERAARWLEAAGVAVPWREEAQADGSTRRVPDCTLEISPLTAAEADDLAGAPLPRTIDRGGRVAL